MYTGPEDCATAGLTVKSRLAVNTRRRKFLGILERHSMSDFVIAESIWMDFERVARGPGGKVSRTPRSGNGLVHHLHFRVDPEHCQIERDEEHMDGGVGARIAPHHEQQALVRGEAGVEHQSAQTAEKRLAKFNARRGLNRLIEVLYENERGRHLSVKRVRRS